MTRNTEPVPAPAEGVKKRRRRRTQEEPRQDLYERADKHPEPTVCAECNAVWRHGRWQWAATAEGARSAVCPACRRIKDNMPAGWLRFEGDYAAQHRAELLRIAREEAESEKAENPLHRLMKIDEAADRMELTTTDVRLAQRIGEAVRRLHHGTLVIQYRKDEFAVRANWRR